MSKSGAYLVSVSSFDSEKSRNLDSGKPRSPDSQKSSEVKYTNPDDIDLKMKPEQQTEGVPFRGMGKEELLRHSSKPFWVRLRMICVSIVLIGWLALIITVVALIFAYPKCRDKDARSWWQNDVIYRIYVRSFYDSNGDGNGDLKGVQAKLDYIKKLGVGTISLSPIFATDATEMDFSIINHTAVSSRYGTDQDLRDLIKAVHDNDMHIVLDFIPNHTSDKHPWFVNSATTPDRGNPHRNYYVWTGEPSNWKSVYGNSSWTMTTPRNQYYLHQFSETQPDLNLRSALVMKELQDIMEYWLVTENVDGLYIRSSGYMQEDYDMRNETSSGQYTYGLPDNLLTLSKFRELADDYSKISTRIIMANIKGTTSDKLTYYGHFPGSGVHLSINVFPENATCNGKCVKENTNSWLSSFSTNKWPNWMTGNDEIPRFRSRFASNYSKPHYMLTMLLPGTPIIYYGDELGMSDLPSKEQPWSPKQPMRGLMQWANLTDFAGFQANCTLTCTRPWIDVNSDFTSINAESQTESADSLFSFIKDLAALRSNDAFRYGEYRVVVSTDNIFSFVREFDGVTGYLVAINFGVKAEKHDYTSYHSTIQSPATAVLVTGSDVGFSVDDDVNTNSLTLSPLQGIVVSWDFKAKEL